MKLKGYGLLVRFVFSILVAITAASAGTAMANDGGENVANNVVIGESVTGESAQGEDGASVDGQPGRADDGTAVIGASGKSAQGQYADSGSITDDDVDALLEDVDEEVERQMGDASLDELVSILVVILFEVLGGTLSGS